MKKWIFAGAFVLIIIVVFSFARNRMNNPKVESGRLENEIELADIPTAEEYQKESNEIPQGTFVYGLYFSEFSGRMENSPCNVTIKGNHIIVEKMKDSELPGPKLIIEGELLKHKSGRWIISRNPEDVNSDEIGGCSDGPTPIDFDTKIIEWC